MIATFSPPAIFTSIAANYLPKARVLAESVKRHVPDAHFALVMTDRIPEEFNLTNEPFDSVILIEQLGIPNWEQWLFQHSIVEACTGVKPYALLKLLENHEQVFYFDPDIALFGPITAIQERLSKSSLVLTPHGTATESGRAIVDNEICFLKHGLYNLGFVGVRKCPEGLRFAQWWADRCRDFCFDDIPAGMFTDQKWIDLAPIYFEDVGILKEPEYNVCTWNYTHRQLEGTAPNNITVNGRPLIFHHFSGYDSGAHAIMRDLYGKTMPAALALSDWYEEECQRLGEGTSPKYPWAYGRFENGDPILPAHRQLLRQREDLRKHYKQPFSLIPEGPGDSSYYGWLDRQGMLDMPAEIKLDPSLSFGAFLRQTEQNLYAFLQRTPRLPAWVKRATRGGLHAVFSVLHGGLRMAGQK